MTIEIPDWCKIGELIEFKYDYPDTEKSYWYTDRIIAYTEDGFYHQAQGCPMYHHKFSDYGKTVRLPRKKEEV